jgi:copper chaperone
MIKNKWIAVLGFSLFLTTTSFAFAQTAPKTMTLDIKGMSCGMCAAKIENSLKKLEGVSKTSVDHKTGKGTVEYDESKVSADKIVETCNKTGFKCQAGS